MDIGTSIALFLGLAIFLMLLFCLVTKYFQYKMNKKMQQQGQAYSQVDQITQISEEDLEGQYEQFLEKRKTHVQQSGKKLGKSKKREQDYLFQNTQIQSPMRQNSDPIYGVSMLRRRLDGQVLPMKQETGRSLHSAKSFRPERLNTNRSSQGSDKGGAIKPQLALIVHEFPSKLITYNQQGLLILDIIVSSLCKKSGKVTQKKVINTTKVNPLEQGFADKLEVLGFQLNTHSCCKFKTKVQIPFMIQNQQYMLSSLKTSQSKQQIDFSQFYFLKDKVQNG